MSRRLTPFHLAIPVHDVAAARAFYGGLFGCPEGRSAERWVDFDLYGHQLVCHQVDGMAPPVALLVHQADEPRRASFHPFAAFSPEWVALRHGLASGAAVCAACRRCRAWA